MTIRIAMWSGPRNISTAMMRSFGSRSDTLVSDEPFYGAFLKSSGADHPMREAIVADMDCDWHSVLDKLAGPTPAVRPIWYQKHMWHHMVGPIGYDDFRDFTHAFLIRDPARMIRSYLNKREVAAFEDFALDRQAEFFDREAQRLGHSPPVIDADDVLRNPAGALAALCARLSIPFDDAMLRWAPGPRSTDGIWASHWYDKVEQSTGFEAWTPNGVALPDKARRLAEQCRPFYEQLAMYRPRAEKAG